MKDNSKFLYFAYGSNMLSRRLRNRTPSATVYAIGFVEKRRLTFDKVSADGSGKCDVQPSKDNDVVYGVVFEILSSEKPALDAAEGLNNGYREEILTITIPSGNITALAYVATAKNSDLLPYHWYKTLVLAGALENSLPAGYVDEIRAVVSKQDMNKMRRARNEAFLRDVQSTT